MGEEKRLEVEFTVIKILIHTHTGPDRGVNLNVQTHISHKCAHLSLDRKNSELF